MGNRSYNSVRTNVLHYILSTSCFPQNSALSILSHFGHLALVRPFTLTESKYFVYFLEKRIPVSSVTPFLHFYSEATLAPFYKRRICYGKYLHSSMHPSHSGIVSRRGNADGCGLHHRLGQCLYLSDAKNGDGDHHVQVKIKCKEVDPHENRQLVYISPHNSKTVQ